MKTQTRRPWIVSEALAVSILTGLAYCLIYAFTLGRALQLGIPMPYISVGPEELIAFAVLLILFFSGPVAAVLRRPFEVPVGFLRLPAIMAVTETIGIALVFLLMLYITNLSIADFFRNLRVLLISFGLGALFGTSQLLVYRFMSARAAPWVRAAARAAPDGKRPPLPLRRSI